MRWLARLILFWSAAVALTIGISLAFVTVLDVATQLGVMGTSFLSVVLALSIVGGYVAYRVRGREEGVTIGTKVKNMPDEHVDQARSYADQRR